MNFGSKTMNTNELQLRDNFISDIKGIIETAKTNAVRSVDYQRVIMYWRMGERIVVEEQQGKVRAEYLVFYYRLLRCFVLFDVKTKKITHKDTGQLQMYVNYYDREEKLPDENQTIGVLLCAAKNNTLVK